MDDQEDSRDTFAQWRIWIIKTLDKLSSDVESLKRTVADREDYLRRFDAVEIDLENLRKAVESIGVITAVTRQRTLIIWSILGAISGAVMAVVVGRAF